MPLSQDIPRSGRWVLSSTISVASWNDTSHGFNTSQIVSRYLYSHSARFWGMPNSNSPIVSAHLLSIYLASKPPARRWDYRFGPFMSVQREFNRVQGSKGSKGSKKLWDWPVCATKSQENSKSPNQNSNQNVFHRFKHRSAGIRTSDLCRLFTLLSPYRISLHSAPAESNRWSEWSYFGLQCHLTPLAGSCKEEAIGVDMGCQQAWKQIDWSHWSHWSIESIERNTHLILSILPGLYCLLWLLGYLQVFHHLAHQQSLALSPCAFPDQTSFKDRMKFPNLDIFKMLLLSGPDMLKLCTGNVKITTAPAWWDCFLSLDFLRHPILLANWTMLCSGNDTAYISKTKTPHTKHSSMASMLQKWQRQTSANTMHKRHKRHKPYIFVPPLRSLSTDVSRENRTLKVGSGEGRGSAVGRKCQACAWRLGRLSPSRVPTAEYLRNQSVEKIWIFFEKLFEILQS